MVVGSRVVSRLESIAAMAFGLAILVSLGLSPYPADVLGNLPENLRLAGLSAVVCAVGFGAATVFLVGGARLWVAHSKTLELTEENVRLSSAIGATETMEYSDVVRISAMPSREAMRAWVVEFSNGRVFGADQRFHHFVEGFDRLQTLTSVEVEDVDMADFDPWRRTPAWLRRMLGR